MMKSIFSKHLMRLGSMTMGINLCIFICKGRMIGIFCRCSLMYRLSSLEDKVNKNSHSKMNLTGIDFESFCISLKSLHILPCIVHILLQFYNIHKAKYISYKFVFMNLNNNQVHMRGNLDNHLYIIHLIK